MYDTKQIDPKKLEYLRNNTFLGPIAIFKIARAKKQIDEFRKWYNERENEIIDADYSIADELEYELRFNSLQNSVAKMWSQYGDGLGLAEFTDMVIEQNIQKGASR